MSGTQFVNAQLPEEKKDLITRLVGTGSEASGNWERGWCELGARLVGTGSEASGNWERG